MDKENRRQLLTFTVGGPKVPPGAGNDRVPASDSGEGKRRGYGGFSPPGKRPQAAWRGPGEVLAIRCCPLC